MTPQSLIDWGMAAMVWGFVIAVVGGSIVTIAALVIMCRDLWRFK